LPMGLAALSIVASCARCCEQDTADHDSQQERAPERCPVRNAVTPRDCVIHSVLRLFLRALRVPAVGLEAVTLFVREARSYGRHRLCDLGVTAGRAPLAWKWPDQAIDGRGGARKRTGCDSRGVDDESPSG
jgi:hypothetical protein